MIDFLMISTRSTKRGVLEIYPKFIIKKSNDLMIRGGDFYAIWVEERGLWSTDEQDALALIDRELDIYAQENQRNYSGDTRVLHMWDAESGMIDAWHKYCQKQMRDSFHMLDEKLIFSNSKPSKRDYASKMLPYPLEPCSINAYDKLMSTLYSEDERRKIEWAIGAVISGDSKKIQKFLVLYGAAGTGKSTVLNIIQELFEGYYSVFDAKALGSSNNAFALESFKSNPLVAIQHDGDLSRIEDNTRLNSLVSHEMMTVNEKFKSTYSNRFKVFLFMGTNKPVRITDAKSGLIRRLIDVSPSGNKIPISEYRALMKQIEFELGGIAIHCREVYEENKTIYDDYIPLSMLGASNDFYNFIFDSYPIFKQNNSTTLKAAWEMYKTYCEEAKVLYPMSQRAFKEELKNYFKDYEDRFTDENGARVRSFFYNFRYEKFIDGKETSKKNGDSWLQFNRRVSVLDDILKDCPAQLSTESGKPISAWSRVKTTLKDIDTHELHYVKVPQNHIVIDFDIPDEDGNKSLKLNMEAASKMPPTYAELSKSGSGIHLHYLYSGDASELSNVYGDHIEIKVFSGNSSLRRKLTKCNDIFIATISSGLPKKGAKKVVNLESVKSEKSLRSLVKKNLNKEFHPATKPSIDFIFKILEDAYNSDLKYDISDMKGSVLSFAAGSSNQSAYCVKLVSKMHFCSKDAEVAIEAKSDDELIFFDIECFPNLFYVGWKKKGKDIPIVRMINPTPTDIEALIQYNLVGFNNRRYDNHLLYARLMGYSNEELYQLSQKIISGDKNAFFSKAYDLSYTDIYDFASAGNKKSLKKLEVEMGIHHQELGFPWDQPVPEDKWHLVAEYCDNDILATEAAFDYLSADWTARKILADLAGMTVNDTTNTLTTKIIFGNEKNPQSEFCYRDLSKPVKNLDEDTYIFLSEACPEMMSKTHGEAGSLLPYFPGYKYESGVSTYKGEEVGEGGYVYAEPGMYGNVALLDVASMHPHSAIAEAVFGVRYTKIFREIVEGRVDIKHEEWDKVNDILGGKLTKHIEDVKAGKITSKDLANGLKTAINSVYGLTAATFNNPFRDIRNVDNIVAKRGALFMVDLKEEVRKRGYVVAHIKTDSIKIPDATPEIIDFVMEFGKRYGYSFEHEATYEKMCLVNDAVYVAKYATPESCEKLYGYIPGDNAKKGGKWTATGTQFQIPYVFKKLFSREEIIFDDMCVVNSVSTSIYLDLNEKLEEGQHDYIFIGKVGQFTPIKKGFGGGELVRQGADKDGNVKYSYISGSKGYRWKESEVVRAVGNFDEIDRLYFDDLVTKAVNTIALYGDYEWFISEDPYIQGQTQLAGDISLESERSKQ